MENIDSYIEISEVYRWTVARVATSNYPSDLDDSFTMDHESVIYIDEEIHKLISKLVSDTMDYRAAQELFDRSPMYHDIVNNVMADCTRFAASTMLEGLVERNMNHTLIALAANNPCIILFFEKDIQFDDEILSIAKSVNSLLH